MNEMVREKDFTPENVPQVDVSPEPLKAMPRLESEKVFTLDYPIQRLNGQQIEEVRLRIPTALDMFEVGGMPSRTQWMQGGMSMEMDVQRLQEYIVRLSGLERPTVIQAPRAHRTRDVRVAAVGVEQRGKLMMIVAFLAFEAGFCRDDPARLLQMPLRHLLFWYDLYIGWREKKAEVQAKAQAKQQFRARSFSR